MESREPVRSSEVTGMDRKLRGLKILLLNVGSKASVKDKDEQALLDTSDCSDWHEPCGEIDAGFSSSGCCGLI